MNVDLVLAGVGGQGVLSIAWVLDHAAHAAGWQLKQSEVHGMAQRGGAVSAFVRLSDAPIASDLIAAGTAQLIAAVEPLEALRYTGLLRADGAIVTDVTPMVNIDNYPDLAALQEVLFSAPHLVAVDATRLAHAAGTVKAQNTVVLGAAAPLLPLPVDALEAQLQALFEPKGDRIVQGQPARLPQGQHGLRLRAGAARRGRAVGARGAGQRASWPSRRTRCQPTWWRLGRPPAGPARAGHRGAGVRGAPAGAAGRGACGDGLT
jgi:indolepyruvate ferredoxin oxidoreductase beta subunit